MGFSGKRWGVMAVALVVVAAAAAEDPAAVPPPDARPQPAPATSPGPSPISDADLLKIPTDAILVICKEVKDALRLAPEGVVLTPEKYQALMERIDQLERQLKTAPAEVPSSCKLSGQVEGDLVRFQAQFDFRTTRPRAVVALGCQRAWLKPGATLDGHLPLLLAGEDGLIKVQVDTPGDHQLSLELELPLAARGTKGLEQGFDFGLPRAAITTLDQLTLARSVAEVRVNGRPVRTSPVDAQHSRLEGVPLGPAERLEMVWKGPAGPAPKAPPILEAEGRIAVRVTDSSLTTDVDLTLQALGGEVRQWRIQLPPQLVPEIKEPRPQDERIAGVDLPDAHSRVLTVRLKEASGEPLRLRFQVRQGRPKGPVPIGPFLVLGALRQRGTIWLSAPSDLRLRYHLRGEVTQRELSDEARRDTNTVAELSYVHLTAPNHPNAPVPAPLELQVEEVKGTVEARVDHTLHLDLDGHAWQVVTRIQVTPTRTKLDHLDVELPAAYQYQQPGETTPADLVDGVEVTDLPSGKHLARVKFIKEQGQPFTVTLQGAYPLAREGAEQASFELPRPAQGLDRGGQVTVLVPEGMELVVPGSAPEGPFPWQPVAGSNERQHAWRSDRFANRLDLVWQPHRPERKVTIEVDVTVAGHQARVRQAVHVQLAQAPEKHLALVIPAALQDRVRLEKGGTLEPNGDAKLASPAAAEATLVFSYFLPVEDDGHDSSRRLRLPLVRVAQATVADTKVRVWSDAGLVPSLVQGTWEERPTEIVRDHDTLPALVLHSVSLTPTLTLGLKEAAASWLAPVVVDQALVQVTLAEGGYQQYRARFLVSRLNRRELDVELPAPLNRLNPQLFLGGKKVTRLQTLSTGAPEGDGGTTVRLTVDPDLWHQPVILEIQYQMPPAPQRGSPWLATLTPPLLRGDTFLGRVRWQVEFPPGWGPLYPGGGTTPEQRWIWKGLLLTPVPARTGAELERWLTASSASAGEEEAEADPGEPGLVCWQTALGPVPLVYGPQPIWLLVCSLLFLLFSLGLSFAPLSRLPFWVLVLGLSAAAALGALWWPAAVPAVVYGCEPGIVVLVVVLGLQWMVHQRYRRQVVFLPSFTRLKTGSSVQREANRRRGEPSTVDAPAKRDSSLKPAALEPPKS